MDVTLVIPAYNEEKNIANVLTEIKTLSNLFKEIIVVDDGSKDNTSKEVNRVGGVKLVRHPYNIGYGAALKTGARAATSEFVMYIDADGQHQTKDIKRLLEHVDKFDMVIGARNNESKITPLRIIGKSIIRFTANYFAGREIPDLNSGFRIIKKSIIMQFIHLLPDKFSFTTTITLACIKSGYSIKYVPIKTLKTVGKSKIKPFRDGAKFIYLIVKTTLLFSPMRVFMPVILVLGTFGIISLVYDLISAFNISDTSLILLISVLIISLFAMLSEQIAYLQRRG